MERWRALQQQVAQCVTEQLHWCVRDFKEKAGDILYFSFFVSINQTKRPKPTVNVLCVFFLCAPGSG